MVAIWGGVDLDVWPQRGVSSVVAFPTASLRVCTSTGELVKGCGRERERTSKGYFILSIKTGKRRRKIVRAKRELPRQTVPAFEFFFLFLLLSLVSTSGTFSRPRIEFGVLALRSHHSALDCSSLESICAALSSPSFSFDLDRNGRHSDRPSWIQRLWVSVPFLIIFERWREKRGRDTAVSRVCCCCCSVRGQCVVACSARP